MNDVRFPTALQAMLSLALAKASGVERLSSANLSAGTGTHPTLMRRLLGDLANAGLLVSSKGRDGGVALARPESEITLADIHAAVTGEKGLWRPREDIPHRCIVSKHMTNYFGKVDAEAAAAAHAILERRTLAMALAEIREMEAAG
ncbi:RrF2 family transcriptional regulator [Insolitispirillum peregrinum]|uniref:Transcriptional regulator, BadM/Rrf2 family n=1 Tax=Insolitispirillum peregrinum TaxID=80876 RepID=A0A1N7PTJ6_9PROT|nr:Rrf2 family transcriptional regulator [Insolitispirillum peregrinum]SIT13870.1 transcriptional regulator, BadM/Rrf2 family [Insolitispirillum peregrinum]